MAKPTAQQRQIGNLAEGLLHVLEVSVPPSTVHFAVEDARRALLQLSKMVDTIKTKDVD